MASLASLLPKPKFSIAEDVPVASTRPQSSSSVVVPAGRSTGAPPYGKRKGWIPRTLQDFGDGGAFPEIHMAQYPLEMGKRKKSVANSQVVSLQVDDTGRVQFEALAQHGHSDSRVVYSRHKDLVPMDIKDGDEALQRPSPEEVEAVTKKTKEALERIVDGKVQSKKATHITTSERQVQYVRYTPQILGTGEAGATRVVRMVEVPEDPFEPPRFRHKKLPKGPSSPPAPVMHSPPRKITIEEKNAWYIPPCISNWKNAKGYTIPLDKRLAADGRGLQEVTINDNFAKFAEALYIADRHAREEVEKRAQMQKKIAQKDKEAKEEHLRMLAQKARIEKAGFAEDSLQDTSAPYAASPSSPDNREDASRSPSPRRRSRHNRSRSRSSSRGTRRRSPSPPRRRSTSTHDQDDAAYLERERLRKERERDIQRKIRMSHMGTEAKSKYAARALDRDVSEKIALGQAAPTVSQETMYDQRLFNQSAGMSSGFKDDDAYNLYDKPLFMGTAGASIYRPKNLDADLYGGSAAVDIDSILAKNSFVPDKGFSGTETAEPRDGAVLFEKAAAPAPDPFGLDEFLSEAKKGKRGLNAPPAHEGATSGSSEGGKRRKA